MQPGSNAWAVSGARSATGKPILANDPHLEFGIPSTWYMVHLRSAGAERDRRLAAGRPGGDHRPQRADRVGRDQSSIRRSGSLPASRSIRRAAATRFAAKWSRRAWNAARSASKATNGGGLRAVGHAARPGVSRLTEGQYRFPALGRGRARPASVSVSGYRPRATTGPNSPRALQRFPGPGQNFVYADVDGNIGYQATGLLPIRPAGCDGQTSRRRRRGQLRMAGIHSISTICRSFYNPARGMIVTANQNPFPADYQYPVAGDFGAHYRSTEIRTLLNRQPHWKPADMLIVQKDVYSATSTIFWPNKSSPRSTRRSRPARRLATRWISSATGAARWKKEPRRAMIVELTYLALRKAVADRAAPGLEAEYEWPAAPVVIEKLLRERPAGWFPDYDALLLQSLGEAIDQRREDPGLEDFALGLRAVK